MRRLLHSFLLLLATATDRELVRQLQFLKVENEILRAKLPQRITVAPRERQRLVKFGKVLGSAVRDMISIVSPRTFLRWLNDDKPAPKKGTRKPGRSKTRAEIRDLILKLARENEGG